MLRLKATKRRLYKLVAAFEDLPAMTETKFIKAYRDTSYWLRWYSGDLWCEAFLSVCGGRPLLAITKKDYETQEAVSRAVHTVPLEDLRYRDMVENFTTAAERAREKAAGMARS